MSDHQHDEEHQDDTVDERSARLPRSRDDSVASVLEAEPALLGAPLLIVGTSVLTERGDVVDVVAVDSTAAVHVISVADGVADARSVGGLVGLSAWARSFSVAELRRTFAAYHEGTTLDDAFSDAFEQRLPDELAADPVAVVVAAAFDEDAAAHLEEVTAFNDNVRAFAFQEYVDDEDDALYVMTHRVV